MPAITPSSQYSQIPGQPPAGSPSEPPIPESPFHYGPFVLQPDLSYQLSYESGLQAAPGRTANVTVQTFSAEMIVQEGTVWNLAYTPKWVRYSSSLFENAVDQDAKLGASFPLQDWQMQLGQTYSRSSDPLIETGRQTRQQSYASSLKGLCDPSASQLSFEVDLTQDIRFTSLSPSIYDWTNEDWVHFPLSPQLDIAAGAGVGYTHENPGFDMAFVKPQAKITWHPSTKVKLDAEAGTEESRYFTADRETSKTPVFAANLSYQPFLATTLAAGATRDVAASILPGEVSESTKFTLQAEQRLLTHYFFSVQAGTGKTNYLSAGSALASQRGDTTGSLEASLSTVIFRRLNLGLSASRVHNSSSIQGFGLSSNQFGFQAALKY
jgi:hypothetical protein